jgi:hypothetical protein
MIMMISISMILTSGYLSSEAKTLNAGAIITNGGDRGIPYEVDYNGDVCVKYEDEEGFATVTTSNIVELEIAQVYGIKIEPASTTVRTRRGETVYVDYVIENTGNGKDTINLRVFSKEWRASVSPTSVVLAPEEKKNVRVKINVPIERKVIGKTSAISLIATSSGSDTWGDADKVKVHTIVDVIPHPCPVIAFFEKDPSKALRWCIGILLLIIALGTQ